MPFNQKIMDRLDRTPIELHPTADCINYGFHMINLYKSIIIIIERESHT